MPGTTGNEPAANDHMGTDHENARAMDSKHSLSEDGQGDGKLSSEDRAVGIDGQMFGDEDNLEVDGSKLLRKLDWHLIPWFSLLYLLSFLDSKYEFIS